jgi:2'-5' RNA ligase
VLAVGLDDSSGSVVGLQAALANVLQAGGWYRPEKRPYLAHVTVARVGRGATKASRSPLPAPPAISFAGENVTLYRSRLLRSGAQYEALRTVALAAY